MTPEVRHGLSRRGFLVGGASLAALLAACGSETTPTAGPAAAGGSGYPVAVAHKYGTTTIPAAPKRVVTVGFTDPDYVLALGFEPVAITDWYGDQPDGVWPWARDALGAARPAVMPRPQDDKLNFELIASFQPDLIIGSYTGMSRDEYDRATRLAPTVAQSGEHKDYLTPWQVTMRTFGTVFDSSARAEELIAGVESRFAAARRDHPEFAGATMVIAERFESGSTYVRTANEPQNGLFRELGFVQPESITALLVDEDGYSGTISDERMELLDTASVLVWKLFEDPSPVPAELAAHPVYPGLRVVREGRDVFLRDQLLTGALAFGSALSLPYALDRIVPLLTAALDGTPPA